MIIIRILTIVLWFWGCGIGAAQIFRTTLPSLYQVSVMQRISWILLWFLYVPLYFTLNKYKRKQYLTYFISLFILVGASFLMQGYAILAFLLVWHYPLGIVFYIVFFLFCYRVLLPVRVRTAITEYMESRKDPLRVYKFQYFPENYYSLNEKYKYALRWMSDEEKELWGKRNDDLSAEQLAQKKNILTHVRSVTRPRGR